MNIDLLMNNQAEAVSLSEQGIGIVEYLHNLVSGENTPATMMVNIANGELLRNSTPSASDEIRNITIKDGDMPAMAGGQMTITINEMLTDNDVLLFRAKPKTQGVGIGEALQQLLDSKMQMGVSAEFLGERDCLNSTAREVESRCRAEVKS